MKWIKGYEGYYKISKDGEIFRDDRKLKNHIDTNGYMSITLCVDGESSRYRVHRLVAQTYIDNPSNKPQVNHKNGIKSDNRVSNLEWVTQKENNEHSIRVLKNPKPPTMEGKFGSDHNRSKGIVMAAPNGDLIMFGSGLEAKRRFGLDHSSISYMSKNREVPYLFKRGALRGWVLLAYGIKL